MYNTWRTLHLLSKKKQDGGGVGGGGERGFLGKKGHVKNSLSKHHSVSVILGDGLRKIMNKNT